MNKPKRQGTAFESALVRQAQEFGLLAGRFPEGGSNDIGDVWINDLPQRGSNALDIPVLAWSRLVKNGDGRRVPDGTRAVAVLDLNDFLKLCGFGDAAFTIECKATQTLNVTRTLADAKQKLAKWKART